MKISSFASLPWFRQVSLNFFVVILPGFIPLLILQWESLVESRYGSVVVDMLVSCLLLLFVLISNQCLFGHIRKIIEYLALVYPYHIMLHLVWILLEFFQRNWALKYFCEMDSLYSIGTCLVIVIISIRFAFLAKKSACCRYFYLNLDFKPRINTIFLQDTYSFLHSPWFWRLRESIAERQGYPKLWYCHLMTSIM